MDKTIMQTITELWQRVKAWGEIRERSELVFLGAVGVALFVLFAVIFLPFFSGWVVWLLSGEKERVIKLIGWGIAGILAFFGAVAVNRRADAQVKVANAQVENNKLIEKGHIQERFKTAVDHLGGERVAARIASFYEFSYLACDNEDLRRNIFDILCAHLRQTTADKEYQEKIGFTNEGENSGVRPTEEVQSLLGVLFKSKDGQEELIFGDLKPNLRGIFLMRANLEDADLRCANLEDAYLRRAYLRNADLRGVDLRNADLWGADLEDADLRSVDLRNANLQDAYLRKADLREARLQGANLQGTNLPRANLRAARLYNANLQGAYLYGADLREARLYDVNLQRAHLYDTDLRGADLENADLENTNLDGADLRGVDLRKVKNLETAKLRKTKIKDAKFPDGYKPPADADTTTDVDTTGDD